MGKLLSYLKSNHSTLHKDAVDAMKLHTTLTQQAKQELSIVQCFSSITDMQSNVGMLPYISFTIYTLQTQD